MKTKKLTIKQIKTEMLNYRDFWGGDIPNTDDIAKAKTKTQLAEILNQYRNHIENVGIDAIRHHDSFTRGLGEL